ncbi:MAG: ParB N-terminal domain-containing protein [Xanthobacteraceae bacterium]
MRSLSDIKESPKNARRHGHKQIAALMNSVATFCFITPLIVDEGGQLLSGHARAAAARNLGIVTVPTVCASHLSEAQKRAFILADNRLAQLATWDEVALKRELEFLSEFEVDFDFSAIGFGTAEVSFILDRNEAPGATRPQRRPKPTGASAVSRPGDIWRLGDHFICCGSAGLEQIDAVIRGWQVDSGSEAIDARSGERFGERQRIEPSR